MKENKIWNDYLPEDMQEHWTVYECLKESEDSSTFLVKETATGILCVLKWGRNRQTEFLRNEMEIMKKMADRKLSGIPKAYRIFEENGEVYLVREYIEGMSLAQMVLQKGGISEAEICRISRKICQTAEQFQNPNEPMIHRDIKPENIVSHLVVRWYSLISVLCAVIKKMGRVILLWWVPEELRRQSSMAIHRQTSVQMCMQSDRQCCIWFQRAMK